jgi:hypothetical protein
MSDALLLFAAGAGVVLLILLSRWLSQRLQLRRAASPPFAGDPDNDKRLTVRGWEREALRAILDDFAKLYELPRTFATDTPGAAPATTVLSFPQDLPADTFFFLVNYLHYPIDRDLPEAAIAAAGSVTLTPAFAVPDPALLGKTALVYVPEGDQDYDVVYVEVASAGVYSVSFTDMRWRPAQSSRQPAWLHEL